MIPIIYWSFNPLYKTYCKLNFRWYVLCFSILTFYNWSMPVPNILKSPANESSNPPRTHHVLPYRPKCDALRVNRCLASLSPHTKVSLHPTYLNPTSQIDTVAGDRPGNSWHHSSGKIMSSHRPEIGRRVCVD